LRRKDFNGMATSKDAKRENTKPNYGMDTTGEKEKRTSKGNVDGRSTSSHENNKLRTRSSEKKRGMSFGFRKTATVVKNTGYIDRKIRNIHGTYTVRG
jgi:hypothetical protein